MKATVHVIAPGERVTALGIEGWVRGILIEAGLVSYHVQYTAGGQLHEFTLPAAHVQHQGQKLRSIGFLNTEN